MPKVRKAELSFLYKTCRLVLFYISVKYHRNIPKGIPETEQMRNLFQTKQEAHWPRVAHLSDRATPDMQMLCNIFPILSSQLMKSSSFKQFLILKKNIIYGMTVNGA